MQHPMEAHVDQVLSEGAADLSTEMEGQEFDYSFIPLGYMIERETEQSGVCRCLGVSYNKQLDCNVYHMLDLETEHEFRIDEFEIELVPR